MKQSGVSLSVCQQQWQLVGLLLSALWLGGSVAEWLAYWTQAQKGLGSNRSRDAVG